MSMNDGSHYFCSSDHQGNKKNKNHNQEYSMDAEKKTTTTKKEDNDETFSALHREYLF